LVGRVPARPARERATPHCGPDVLRAVGGGERSEVQPTLQETRSSMAWGDTVVAARSIDAGAQPGDGEVAGVVG
jgi:hypothetical protein